MILSNQIRCRGCGDVIWSAHRHDITWCGCGAVAVDGGMDYLKRIGSEWEEQSIVVPDDLAARAVLYATDAEKRGCNPLGYVCAVFRAMRDAGYAGPWRP